MSTTPKNCPHCGGNDFFILEVSGWKAFVDETGEVQAHFSTSEIENVTCRKCDAEFSPIFFGESEINFN